MKHASFAVCVHNITKDSTIYSRNDDLSMIPAAINKLFTTAAAYSRLGPKFNFENYLYYSGRSTARARKGDLIVVGTGDPFFCSDRFPHTDSTFHRLARGHPQNGHPPRQWPRLCRHFASLRAT